MFMIEYVVLVYALMWFFVTSAMNKLKMTSHGDTKQAGHKWIEVKVSHIMHALLLSADVL